MAEYIDREALIADIEKRYCQPCEAEGKDSNHVRCLACWVDDMVGEIGEAPFSDVATVVRCKDCKHGIRHSFYVSYKCTADAEYDEALGGYVGFTKWQNADDYCSRGERKSSNDPT